MVVVVDTAGRGVIVVVRSVEVLDCIGGGDPPQAAKRTVMASAPTPIPMPRHDFVSIIVWLLKVRMLAGCGRPRCQRTVVDSVLLRVVDMSPLGVMPVPDV